MPYNEEPDSSGPDWTAITFLLVFGAIMIALIVTS